LLTRQASAVTADIQVLIMGFTFKENCPDIRNTKVIDLVHALTKYGIKTDIVDPVADHDGAKHEYKIDILKAVPSGKKYNAAVFAVPHRELVGSISDVLEKSLSEKGFLLDIKGVLPPSRQILH
jgi:UDP-N-acetyl-D-galactosamine dehydrogenase